MWGLGQEELAANTPVLKEHVGRHPQGIVGSAPNPGASLCFSLQLTPALMQKKSDLKLPYLGSRGSSPKTVAFTVMAHTVLSPYMFPSVLGICPAL